MKIVVAAVGKLKDRWQLAAVEDYERRLGSYCKVTIAEAKDEARLIAALPDRARVYAFDERGDAITSRQLADILAAEALHGGGAPVVFAIGGADGHSDALRNRCVRLLAFGRMTIAHRLVRILALEQLYRAFKILSGEPYHRE